MVIGMGFGPMNAAVKGQCVKPLHQPTKMAPNVGLEPTTYRLTAECSTD